MANSGTAEGVKIVTRCEDLLALRGVGSVGFYNGSDQTPEDIPFPSCLAAALRFIGEDYSWTTFTEKGKTWHRNDLYIELLGASGMAFGLRWKAGWYQDAADMMFVADPTEIIRRSFAHVGYNFRGIDKSGNPGDEARFINEITESLRAGRPVLSFGVVGPPECGLITGYDEGGEVLIGWSYFQDLPPFNYGVEHEPDGTYRKRNWFPDTWSLIVIEDKVDRPEPADRNAEILRWAVSVARNPGDRWGGGTQHTGLAAYDAWAKQVTNDADFFTDDERVFRSRHEIHNSAVSIVAECRWAASELLKMMAESQTKTAPDLLAAADRFRREHDLMWQAWGLVGGNGNPKAHEAFVDPQIRKELASVILKARDLDAEAIGIIEKLCC